MGKKKKFGTHAIGGLNTKLVPHELDDHELQECTNASFDEVGAASPLGEDEDLYSGSGYAGTQINALLRAGTEHLYWISDTDIYEDDAIIGLGASVARPILSDGENIYFLDGANSQVYDGTSMRDYGPFVPAVTTNTRVIKYEASGTLGAAMSAATQAAECQITTSVAHGLTTGEYVTIHSVSGMTELNGNIYLAEFVDATNFKIKDEDTEEYIDSTGFGAYTSGGYAIQNPCRISGDYRYAVQYVLTINGTEYPGQMIELKNGSAGPEDSSATTLARTDRVDPFVNRIAASELTDYVADGATVVARLFRTKAGGATYYELIEYAQSDIVGSTASGYGEWDIVSDGNLGAVWTYDRDANDPPPDATLGAIAQQQMFLAGVSGSETNLYFSKISGYGHFKPTDFVDVEARITALAPLADRVVVFTNEKIGTYSPIDEIGQFQWSLSAVGTRHPDGIAVTDEGILFARDDGLWLFDGVTSHKLTEHISEEWGALSGDALSWSIAKTSDMLYCATGSGALVASTVGKEWKWTTLSGDFASRVTASTDGESLYGLRGSNGEYGIGPASIFSGSDRTMTIKFKDWGGWKTWGALQLDIDVAPSADNFTATVTTSTGETQAISFTGSSTADRHRQMLPRNLRGGYANVKIVGTATIKGVELLMQ